MNRANVKLKFCHAKSGVISLMIVGLNSDFNEIVVEELEISDIDSPNTKQPQTMVGTRETATDNFHVCEKKNVLQMR